ncbi:acyltransferase [Cesiribacter sp. SM1]|uniref:acyltransferase family protein n=1 Tax=Cesiribacter sp. SM1 TaxID=2861196 RepID=UPI001CD712B4|nr:acyltransferase [Cesiribacter sp. SM1]
MAPLQKIRRYEFDWLRVLAFSLLIFYHTGMFFVSWNWHIKNNVLSETLEWPMLFLSQWRMSLIFLISGVGVYLAMGFRDSLTFAKDRFKRILLPLLAGMLLVVPPQVYVERLAQGQSFGYGAFYLSIFSFQPYPEGNFSWHHLWYLAYIFTYSLLLLPLLGYLCRHPLRLEGVKSWMLVLLPSLWLGLGEMLLRPHFPATNALIDDWANHFLYVSIFLAGFILISSSLLQEKIRDIRLYSLSLALGLTAVLYINYWLPDADPAGYELQVYYLIKSANRWLWLLSILGFAIRYLAVASPHLKMANEMVYPFYILHQTVIVVLGYFIKDLPWPVFIKFSLLVVLTFLVCYLLIRCVIMKINILRVPFGMKAVTPMQAKPVAAKERSLAA